MRIGRLLARGRWLANRVRGMSAAEILARVGDAFRKRAWRRQPIRWSEPTSDGPMPDWPRLRQRLAVAADMPAVRRALAGLEAGHMSFLGREWPRVRFEDTDASAFWLHDPVGKRRWPGAETSAFVVDIRSTSDEPRETRLFGDVKFVWEPNRLQILHPLAVSLAGGDEAARATAMTIVRSWARANPPYGGVNWTSGIELAMRLVSVALLCAASRPDAWVAADRVFLRGLVAAHAEYLTAFPSRHSSANNHLIAEGLGLLVAGLLMPDHPHWESEGRAILEREAERQILADGVGAEQSPTYQAFTMEMLALGALLCIEAGRPLAASARDRLAAGGTFLRALMNGAGRVPSIGDDDEGRVVAQPPDREPRYVASVVAAVAGLCERPDLMPPAWDPHLRDRLFAAPRSSAPLALGQQTFRQGGYTTSRDRVGDRVATLVFDHGPLGYLSLAAHGHADALAVWLTIDDRPIFIDAGTYLYFAGGARRQRFRQSPAHNTLCLEGASQSVAAAGFSWVHRARAGIVEATAGPRWSVTAWHDGYARRFDVRHERRLVASQGGYAIEDRLVGASAPRPCEVRFLLPATLALSQEGAAIAISVDGRSLCRLVAPRGFSIAIGEAEFSSRFGELAAARAIVLAGPIGADAVTTGIEILAAV